MSIRKTRGLLYRLGRVLGDIQAVQRATIGKRVGRRLSGKATGRFLRNLFK